jgi:hypothetical protein
MKRITSKRWGRRRRGATMHQWRVLAALVVAVFVAGVPGGLAGATGGTPGPDQGMLSAASDTGGNHHCIHPSGADLNEFYGVNEWLVHPSCTQVDAGEPWTVVAIWFVAETFDAVPEEFEPAGDTPAEDFRAKFAGARHVIDPGTSQEQTLFFPADDRLFIAESPILQGRMVVSPIRSTIAHPLSVGDHTVQWSWVMSDLHCDGLGANLAANCLPAGETVLGTLPFEVTVAETALRVQRPSYTLRGARLRAVLANSRSGGPIAGRTVSFRTGGLPLCVAVTDSDGAATCTTGLLGKLAIILNGGYRGAFRGTGDYLASTGTARA